MDWERQGGGIGNGLHDLSGGWGLFTDWFLLGA